MKKADYKGDWKGSARLVIGKDTSTITKALLNDLRFTSMNLLAFGAMDNSSRKNQHELMNMLSNIESLDNFEIKYSRMDAEIQIKVKGKIAVYLPKQRKKRKAEEN